jgi:hypothetical protein
MIDLQNHNTQLSVAAGATGLLVGGFLWKRWNRRVRNGPLTPDTLPEDAYDAVIVGAGTTLRRSLRV